MRSLKGIGALLVSFVLAACGGGGGNPGGAPFGPGAGASGPGGSGASAMSVQVQRAGASTTQITSTETVQAVAVVSSNGAPVQGVVVTFAEQGAGLITFAPASATALTDASGRAVIDVNAADPSQTGATAVSASAQVNAADVTASRPFQITAGATNPGTAPTPAAITFVGSVPSGTAIVVKGAGGTGRSESAILTFKIVDASNAPINGAAVNFSINPANGGATFQPASGVSNSSGLVTTTVSSGTQPASIVVRATSAAVATVTSQSDTLIVSNDIPVAGGFEIVAEKYNLDGRFTGDSTKINAFVRDRFGNPVPDGVAVSFGTDFGVIAASTLGGCTTVNGRCSVDFTVQNPRGNGIATVVGSVQVSNQSTLANQLQINMAAATGTPYLALDPANRLPITQLTLSSCKESFPMLASDGNGRSTAAGTTIAAPFASSNVTVAVKTGTPVLDQLAANFPPTPFGIEVDVSAATLIPRCVAGGTVQASGTFFNLEFKSPRNIIYSQRIGVAYPQ